MAEIAKAYVQIVPTTEGIAPAIESAMNSANVSQSASSSGSNIGGKFVKGLAGAFATGAAVVAASATALWNGINATAQVGDEIDKTSQKLGVQTDQYQALAFAAEHCGFETSTFTMAARNLASSGYEGSLYDALQEITSLDDATQRTAMATELFGERSAQSMAALLNGEQTIDDYMTELDGLGGIMSNDAVKASAAFEDSMTNLHTAMEGAKNTMMAEFLPSVTTVIDGLTALMSGDEGGVEMVSQGISDFTDAIVDAVPGIVEALGGMLPSLLEAGVTIFEGICTGILNALPQLIPVALDLVMNLAQFLIDNLDTIVQVAFELLTQLAFGIAEALPTLIPTIIEVLLSIVDFLIENIDLLIDGAIALVVGLAEGIVNSLPLLIEKIPEIILKLADAIIRNVPKLLAAAGQIIVTLWNGIKNNLPQFLAKIPQIITGLISKLKEGLSKITDVGKNLIEGLWNGINNAKDWIMEKIKGFGDAVLNGLKDFFHIGSPSKLMAEEVGQWLPKGIAVGITANTSAVNDAMDELGTSAVAEIQSGSFNIGSELGNDSQTMMGQILGALQMLVDKDMDFYLDGDVLVGATANRMDAKLGQIYGARSRGR